jgi:hypothetical protein
LRARASRKETGWRLGVSANPLVAVKYYLHATSVDRPDAHQLIYSPLLAVKLLVLTRKSQGRKLLGPVFARMGVASRLAAIRLTATLVFVAALARAGLLAATRALSLILLCGLILLRTLILLPRIVVALTLVVALVHVVRLLCAIRHVDNSSDV